MSDETVIRCCAPTLAAIKTGSIFNCAFGSRDEMTATLTFLSDGRRINREALLSEIRETGIVYGVDMETIQKNEDMIDDMCFSYRNDEISRIKKEIRPENGRTGSRYSSFTGNRS